MIITTTNNIEGLNIRKYLGIVSGTEIYLVGGMIGGGLVNQEGLYTNALKRAMDRMEEKARNLGADAIVGVSSNFTSPGGLNSMIVAVTGTAVMTDIRQKALEEEALARKKEEDARRAEEEAKHQEQERRWEQYRKLSASGADSLQVFLRQAEDCAKVSEVLTLWENTAVEPGPLTEAMDKKIRSSARMEKLYGAAAGNISGLLTELRNLAGVEE